MNSVSDVLTVKREAAATPPPPPTPAKPALNEEELTKKSTAIIEEYLHINDMKVPVNMPVGKKTWTGTFLKLQLWPLTSDNKLCPSVAQ